MRFSPLALSAALVATPLVAQGSLTTTFAGGNSGTTTWTNQLDITVLNPAGVTITAFDVNCENTRAGGVGSPFSLDVYVTPVGGTYVGNETNAAVWTLVSTGNSVSGPLGTPTNVDVQDFVLPPGVYGMALHYQGTAMAYTNGNGSNQSYANADIQLDLGSSTTGLFGSPVYNPRVWNGTVYYTASGAAWSTFGSGCTGTVGEPTLDAAAGSTPRLGTTFTTEIGNLPQPGTPVLVGLGFSNAQWGPVSLPMRLDRFGATGCSLLISLDVVGSTAGAPSVASFALPIPNAPNLDGVVLYYQAFVFDVGANPIGMVLTRGGAAHLGT